MPRFVILEHDFPHLHWDLMLEAAGTLETWRLDHPPCDGEKTIDAHELQNHRKSYLDYEGPISGNRGTVQRWDGGVFIEEADSESDRRKLILHGSRVAGQLILERIEGARWCAHFQIEVP